MKRLLQRCCGFLLVGAVILSTMAAATTWYMDVPSDHWAAESIYQASELGLMNGTSATTFGLGQSLTRGAFAVTLCRLMDWPTVSPESGTFADCAPGDWYYDAVETALSQGAFTTQYDTFRPNDPITREEIAVALVRGLGYTTLAGTVQATDFADVTTNPGYIAMANALGLMNGTSDTTFTPNGYATREQAAVILVRLYEKRNSETQSMGIVYDYTDTTALTAADIIALSVAQLSPTALRINSSVSSTKQITAIDTIHDNDGTALLMLTGTQVVLEKSALSWTELIVEYVQNLDYDGVYLQLEGVTTKDNDDLLTLCQTLAESLGDKALYVAAQPPASNGTANQGDIMDALSQCAYVVLQINGYSQVADGFLLSPMEPMEEVYYALTNLPQDTEFDRLILQLTTTATLSTNGSSTKEVPISDLSTYYAKATVQSSTSQRYGCSYLTDSANDGFSAWYLSADNVSLRQEFSALLGVNTFCASDLSSLLPEVAEKFQ